jgi:hypothetical protein
MKLSEIKNVLRMLKGLGRRGPQLMFHKVLLGAMLAIALLTPFLQIYSLDKFPTTTDDFEVQVTCCLSILGMLLVFARILRLIPRALRWGLLGLPDGSPKLLFVPATDLIPQAVLLHRCVPLRI